MSAVGKLFNTILNKRLNSFLESKNVISPSQIGFTKGARTADNMFVINALISKYTSGKMVSCLYALLILRRLFIYN